MKLNNTRIDAVYFAIPMIAIFGDFVLKRFLSPYKALASLYVLALLVLVRMVVLKRDKQSLRPTVVERRISFVVCYLIAAYCFQALLSLNVASVYAFTHLFYICVPLLYIPVILKYCPDFDLKTLSTIFLIMMIPVNTVGLIQHFIDPGFLISTAYSGTGGIVYRSSYRGIFLRFPSIFVSADRYSAIGLMQFYFTIILLLLSRDNTKRISPWIYFNLISAIAALFIAGSRTRIFIILILMILMTLSSLLFGNIQLFLRRTVKQLQFAIPFALGIGVFVFVYNPGFLSSIGNKFQVINLTIDAIEDGRTKNRVEGYARKNSFSDDISLTGKGLGGLGKQGKPGEMGIQSIWMECGLIGGSFILIGYSGILLILALLSLQAFTRGQPLNVCIFALPALALTSGLVAGLTSVFELSSGILLMSGIGGAIRHFSPVPHYKRL